jgi:ATP-dependent DNA ligase
VTYESYPSARDQPYRSGRSPDWIKIKNPDAKYFYPHKLSIFSGERALLRDVLVVALAECPREQLGAGLSSQCLRRGEKASAVAV